MGGTIDSSRDGTKSLERRLSRYLNETARRIDPPEPKVPFRTSMPSYSWMMVPTAAMVAVLAIIGAVFFNDINRGVTDTEPTVALTAEPPPTGPDATLLTDPDTAVTSSTTLPEGDAYESAQIVVTEGDLGITEVSLQTSANRRVPIQFDFSNISGEPLVVPPVSDGRGGFVFALVDFDDIRPTRDTYMMHIRAGADRPVTLIETKGVADMTVVESDDAWKVVYTTLLDSDLKTWDLTTHGDPEIQEVEGDVFSLGGVSSGGGRYIVYWLEGCPAVRIFNADGSDFGAPPSLAELGCGGASREYVWITPDGARLVLMERNETEELIVVDLETGEEVAGWSIPGYGHLLELTTEEALVAGSAGQTVVDLSTGERRDLPVNDGGPQTITFDRIVLNPNLVIEPIVGGEG